MKIFSSLQKQKPESVEGPDIQFQPVTLPSDGKNPAGQIKIDAAYQIGKLVLVAGWRTSPFSLQLASGSKALPTRELQIARADVATHFNLPSGKDLGFVIVGESSDEQPLTLSWLGSEGVPAHSKPLKLLSQLGPGSIDQGTLGSALGLLATAFPLNSPESLAILSQAPVSTAPCPVARGYLETAAASKVAKEAVIVGWLLQSPGSTVWIEDEKGHCYTLEGAFRRYRQDVLDAVGHEIAHAAVDSGFLARLNGLEGGSLLRLKTVSELGVHVLAEIRCGELPADPVAAARWLFTISTPASELHRRMPLFDAHVIGTLQQNRQAGWAALPVHTVQLGNTPVKPRVSIVIPLYGRTDFVEHQLIEFSKDTWLQQNAEILYVVDDPQLVEPFTAQAQTLHRLYKLPFKWVWGSTNRGFSGANNLGAQVAQGEYLAFLNSDAFPQKPGWLEALVQVLATRKEIGAVGPRLVFADGSIQHGGIEFQRREELGVWVNHHPRMGLDPSLDPYKALTVLPCITGACMVMRRTDFDRVGQWDTGYLIGDFEDSDLCLKLRADGMQVAYLPTVQLTHLERQSFKLLGQDDFRSKVVIYNAVRHQTRWAKLLQTAQTAATSATA